MAHLRHNSRQVQRTLQALGKRATDSSHERDLDALEDLVEDLRFAVGVVERYVAAEREGLAQAEERAKREAARYEA